MPNETLRPALIHYTSYVAYCPECHLDIGARGVSGGSGAALGGPAECPTCKLTFEIPAILAPEDFLPRDTEIDPSWPAPRIRRGIEARIDAIVRAERDKVLDVVVQEVPGVHRLEGRPVSVFGGRELELETDRLRTEDDIAEAKRRIDAIVSPALQKIIRGACETVSAEVEPLGWRVVCLGPKGGDVLFRLEPIEQVA